MKKMIDEIKDLHKLHSVTKDFNHIIEYQPGSWKMFEPSKFIYSFFAFNTLYNYNWQETIERKELIPFSIEYDLSESQKFKIMIDFIFNYFKQSDSTEFIKIILRPNKRENPRRKEDLLQALDGITPDSRITESERESFKKEFKKLLETETLLKGKLKNELLRFVYLVRNNIFHGTKTTIEMTKRNQRLRLDIYSSILIATNEMLFKSLERALNIELDKEYSFRI
ncbi:MAG TPA: hypothetical protein VKA34_05655 [Balneolales bacterium]|nr:hypothetical protein [Balneolales bacterium]